MRRIHGLTGVVILAALLCAPSLKAQTSASRIVAPVDDRSLVTLNGSLSSLSRPEFDRGAASPSAVIPGVRLVLSRSPQQEAALEKFMAQQLDPGSPNFRHWLTPDEFARLYGPSDSDIAAIVGWLQSRGFSAVTVSSGRTSIAFNGSISQIESAFHTSIHIFQHGGQQYFGNVTPPQIPSALVPVVTGVARLTTFEARSHLARGPSGHYDSQLQRLVRHETESSGPSPEFSPSFSGNEYMFMVPADAATVYDTPNVYNANFPSGGTQYTGKGVTIGIGGDAAITTSVVQNYRKLFLNGDTTAPTVTNVGGSAVIGGDSDEAYLDNEVAGGMAPGATIHFYTAGTANNGISGAIEQMLSDNSVDIFSLSFGECELYLTTDDNKLINSWWQQAGTQGIAVTVSSGDDGSAGCDDQNTEQVATEGLNVSGFSTTPYNIAVGGTDFYGILNGNFSQYVNNNTTLSNSYRSALSYIPESPWNDSTSNIGPISSNVTYIYNTQSNIAGGSGGLSNCSVNSTTYSQQGQRTTGTCTSGYPKPSWQTGTGVPSDGARDVPDVSLLAGNGFYGATWLVCSDQDTTPVGNPPVNHNNDCSSQSSAPYGFFFDGVGGTSASAPAFAGILALVEQKVGSRLGSSGAQMLYTIFNGANGSAVFHDITIGNNSVPCQTGTPNCQTFSAGNIFLTGYNTNPGYDRATGIGSVDATQLINAWPGGATGTGTATVTATPASTSITTTQSDTVNVTVAGSGSLGTPTGTVTLTGGGFTSSATTLSAGAASINIPAGAFTITGSSQSVKLTANYSGDANYATATGTTTITVTETRTTPTITATPTSASITTAQSDTVNVTVTGTQALGTPTGTVTLTSSGLTAPLTATLSSGAASINIAAGALTVGTNTMTASYNSGSDPNYANATNTNATTITVTQATKLPSTVTVTPASTTITAGQTLAVQIVISGGTGNPVPTGTVTLTAGSFTTPNGVTLDNTGTADITIPADSFSANGNNSIGVNYSGDSVYNSAPGSASVTVNPPYSVSSTTTSSQPTAVTQGSNGTATVTVKSDGAYVGSVALTCTLATSPTGATDLPGCSVTSGSPIAFSAANTSGTATITITTTAATSSSLQRKGLPGWLGAGSGTALALLVFFGIPARRRGWRNLLGLLVLIVTLASLSACGGGSGSTGGGGNPGTTKGSYTFTVTGTGTPAFTPAPTATVYVSVQ